MRLKNKILELVTDQKLKEELYQKLEDDCPIFYTKQKDCPNHNNVYEFGNTKIVVAPILGQGKFMDGRVKELYGDLTPNLVFYTEELLVLPKEMAIKKLENELTQYDANEVYSYLKNAREIEELHNFADLVELDTYMDETTSAVLQTYMFYYKGNFQSFGCSLITKNVTNDKVFIYDESQNYEKALEYFKNECPKEYGHIFDNLNEEKNRKVEIELE